MWQHVKFSPKSIKLMRKLERKYMLDNIEKFESQEQSVFLLR